MIALFILGISAILAVVLLGAICYEHLTTSIDNLRIDFHMLIDKERKERQSFDNITMTKMHERHDMMTRQYDRTMRRLEKLEKLQHN